jgi:ferrous iron transport protein A
MHLEELSIGDKAKIIGYAPCQTMCRSKLLVMGLTPGTEVQVTGIAPLGDPVKITTRGIVICLRKKEAQILKLVKVS